MCFKKRKSGGKTLVIKWTACGRILYRKKHKGKVWALKGNRIHSAEKTERKKKVQMNSSDLGETDLTPRVGRKKSGKKSGAWTV